METTAPSTRTAGAAEIRQPSYAERAKTLVQMGRVGTLSTYSHHHPGWPFGSVVPYGLTRKKNPIFLISAMAMHTQDLVRHSRTSLTVAQAGWTSNPPASARVTLLGEVLPVPKSSQAGVRAAYLERHPEALAWVEFNDFSFYQMILRHIYFVGRFGAMGWVSHHEYQTALVDPLAPHAVELIDELNRHHGESLRYLCRTMTQREPDNVLVTEVDCWGFQVRIQSAGWTQRRRIPFSRRVQTPDDVRQVLSSMIGQPSPSPV